MLIQHKPDPLEKLALVGDADRFESVGDQPLDEATRRYEASKDVRLMPTRDRMTPIEVAGVMSCITEVTTPRGKKPVLKAMVTTACEKDCHYCPFRAGHGPMRRVTFSPDEMALAFDRLVHAGLVDGIFLSSGIIKGGASTQDKILDTAAIIREQYAYTGYVHLKIMPGSEYDQIVRAMELADRVSINLEGPTEERLNALAPKKELYGDLLQRLQWAAEIKQRGAVGSQSSFAGSVRASIVTQFVVGAVGDTDLELLSLTDKLHRQSELTRAYYSRFNPIEGTPFENLPPVAPLREHRLYQASFLLRDYAWDVEELPFVDQGNLRLDIDPKRAWADLHLLHDPVEVMTAERTQLLRVPGIGPKSADAILRARRRGRLTDLSHLRKIGVRNTNRATPYLLLDGNQPPRQLPLFGEDSFLA